MTLVSCVRAQYSRGEGADLKIRHGAAIHAAIDAVVEASHRGYLRQLADRVRIVTAHGKFDRQMDFSLFRLYHGLSCAR